MDWELTSVSHGSAHMTTRMTRWLAGSQFVKTQIMFDRKGTYLEEVTQIKFSFQ